LFSRRNIKKNVSRKEIILRILSNFCSKFTGDGGGGGGSGSRILQTGDRKGLTTLQ
jgi:hypothetical protein